MKITKEWLDGKNACQSSLDYVIKNGYMGLEIKDFIKKLIYEDRLLDANWLITRYMNKKQKVMYAIFAAEQVIDIFEKKYPGDKRPRKAIDSAKKYLKNPCKKTKAVGADVAAYTAAYAVAAVDADAAAAYTAAVDADAAAAADAAAYAAAAAAYTAADAVDATAAADAAAYAAAAAAAYTAADAAADAAAAYAAARKEMRIKILNYGLGIIK